MYKTESGRFVVSLPNVLSININDVNNTGIVKYIDNKQEWDIISFEDAKELIEVLGEK